MVAGKNNPQALARGATSSPKMPPVPKLRVRRPNKADENPCIGVMSTVLGCWASQGHMATGCAALEQQLRTCMDARKTGAQPKSNINYQLSRFYPQIRGPVKRK